MKYFTIISLSLLGALALFAITFKVVRKTNSKQTSEFATPDPFTNTR